MFSFLNVLSMLVSGKLLPNPMLASQTVAKCIQETFTNKHSHRSTTDWFIDQEIATDNFTRQGNKYKNLLTFQFVSAQGQLNCR